MAEKKDRPTPEQINSAYKAGLFTAADRNDKMRRLAHANLEDIIENQGLVITYFTQTLKLVQENWEDFLELADSYKTKNADNSIGGALKDTGQIPKMAGRIMWDLIGTLVAPLNAFQEVNGATARRWAQDAGASPGLAALIGTVVNVGSGFVPVGKLSQAFAKGVQKNVPELAAVASRMKGTGGDAAKAAEAAKAAKAAEKLADESVAKALADDGVPTLYHGTNKAFDQFDISKAKPGLYGKGIYLTDDPAIASGYAEKAPGIFKTAQPNVRPVKVITEKPFDVRSVKNATYQEATDTKLIAEVNARLVAAGQKPLEGQFSNDILYTKLVSTTKGNLDEANKVLKEHGYDSIIHEGGKGTPETAHNVTVVFDAEKVIPKFSEPTDQFNVPELAAVASRMKGTGGDADDFYKSLRKYYNEIKDVTETKHLKDIEAEADKLGIHLDDLKALGRDTPLSPAQIKAYLKTLDAPTTSLIENARRVLKGEADAGLMQDRMLTEYFSYTPKFRAAEVQAGRTVKVLDADPRMKSITEMMAAWDPESMAKLDIEAARRTIAEDLIALADEAEKLKTLQVIGATSKEAGATFWTKMREAYVNLLLARPVTQVRNFLGNSYAAVNSVAERELAGWLSIDKAQGVVKGEGMRQFQGMMAGFADGITGFKDAFTKITPDEASKLDFIPHQIGGTLGRIVNVPGDTLRGMDNFFKAMLQRGDMYATAMEKGAHMGLEGKALADYVSRRVNIPTQPMLDHAKDFALQQTFANDLGTLGKWAQGIQKVPGMSYLFPFMRTPMNLAKYAWNRTPGLQLLSGSLYQDILAGGARADMAIARLTLSNMMGMFWYGLAKEGMITGGGPADVQLRRSWLATKQPYSIKGGDGSYYPLVGIEPGTTTMNLIADFAEIHNQLDDPTAEQTAMAIMLSGVRDIVDKSYWQSVGQMVDFIGAARAGEEPGRNALRIVQGPFVTAASGGPLIAGTARAIDPVRREARGFLDQVRSRVPGFSADMPPMRDGYGDPLLPPAPLGNNWLGMVSPFVYKPEETDVIKKEGARLQAKLPMFPWSLGGKVRDDFDLRTAQPGEPLPVELTPQQRDRWQVIYRDMLRNPDSGIEAALLNKPEYKNATFAAQRELFMDYLATTRGNAKEYLMGTDLELQKKSVKATAGQILPMLNEEQRPAVEAQVGEALDLIDTLGPEQRDNLMRWGNIGTGEERDQEVIRGIRGEIGKSVEDLNRAASQQGQLPAR